MATSILHIWRGQKIITKSIHYAMNIMFFEAKILAIQCGINCTTQLQDIAHIIIIKNAILATKWIFDSSIYPHQLYSITRSNNLRVFFNKNSNNFILFWNCPSNIK